MESSLKDMPTNTCFHADKISTHIPHRYHPRYIPCSWEYSSCIAPFSNSRNPSPNKSHSTNHTIHYTQTRDSFFCKGSLEVLCSRNIQDNNLCIFFDSKLCIRIDSSYNCPKQCRNTSWSDSCLYSGIRCQLCGLLCSCSRKTNLLRNCTFCTLRDKNLRNLPSGKWHLGSHISRISRTVLTCNCFSRIYCTLLYQFPNIYYRKMTLLPILYSLGNSLKLLQ
jgi:hypothetical protein